MCNILIYFCNTDIKTLQRTSKTSETLETYVCNTRFQHNISLLFRNGGSSARGVHRWREAHRSGGGRGKSGGEGHNGSTHSRRPRRARGAVEREEDGLLHFGAVGMSVGEAEGQWRGRSMESVVAEAAWPCGGAV
jgi:hypothetical protein